MREKIDLMTTTVEELIGKLKIYKEFNFPSYKYGISRYTASKQSYIKYRGSNKEYVLKHWLASTRTNVNNEYRRFLKTAYIEINNDNPNYVTIDVKPVLLPDEITFIVQDKISKVTYDYIKPIFSRGLKSHLMPSLNGSDSLLLQKDVCTESNYNSFVSECIKRYGDVSVRVAQIVSYKGIEMIYEILDDSYYKKRSELSASVARAIESGRSNGYTLNE